MRIAQIANFYGPRSGGLRTAVHALGQGYVDCGDDVLLIVPGARDAEQNTAHGHVIQFRSPRLPGTGGYRVITRGAAVRDALTYFRPDVIEVSDRTTLAGLGTWAHERGIHAVFMAHERVDGVLASTLPAPAVRALDPFARAHTQWLSRQFSATIATTAYAGVELRAAGASVETVPLGVDLDLFHPLRASVNERRAYAPDACSLLVLATRLSREKHPELAVEALRELVARGRAAHLVVAGAGPLARQLERRSRDLPITWLGFVDDRVRLARLLASADVVIAPGPIETFGLAALEALASGTPTVVHAGSALPEIVGRAGVAAEGSPAAMADAVESVLARDGRQRRLDARARAELFPWATSVARMRASHLSFLAGAR